AVEQAGYACLLGAGAADALRRLPRGTLVDPSAGATAFWAPSAGTRVALELSGPGIKDAKRLVLSVDDEDMVDALLETRTDPPRGVDVAVFPGDGHVIGLPRTTRLEVR
ncbi:MAG: phosphonate C-P lyase system protein PhnH, partial [Solirubrobacterales bacterium]|nr:phosphonate C-P lyase system protein PhnH [Solirubrobacterales bacterium]